MGERQGVLSFFPTSSALTENCGSYFFGHTGRIADLTLTADKKTLFTVSTGRGSAFQWKVKTEFQHFEGIGTVSSAYSGTLSANCPAITRPIVLCSNIFPRLEQNEESFVYFRGFSNQFLRKIFGENLSSVLPENPLFQRYPNCSLVLEHVYGFEAYDLRDSILYVPSHLVAVRSETNRPKETVNGTSSTVRQHSPIDGPLFHKKNAPNRTESEGDWVQQYDPKCSKGECGHTRSDCLNQNSTFTDSPKRTSKQ